MAIPDARSGVLRLRHVRCPRCNSVLEEPTGVPAYQCGGCGVSLRAKFSSGDVDTREAPLPPVSAPSSESGRLHPRSQSRRFEGAGDVPGTSASGPDAPSTRHRGADTTTSPSDTGGVLSARKHDSGEQAPPVVEKKGRDRQSTTTNQEEAGVSSEPRSRRGSRDGAELRDSEKRREPEPEAHAARKNGSGVSAVARPRQRDVDEAAATSAARTTTDSEIAGDALKLSPLHEKILKTVDELRGDLSELFSKSPEVEPRTPARRSPPLLPGRDSHVSRPPVSPVPTSRARHADTAAAGYRRGSKTGYVGGKVHGRAAAPRGLPSRRYRRCRADPCERPGPCRYGCCNHGMPECRSHCCGSRAQEPAPRRQKPPAAGEAKRRAPPRQHCRPVLKGAPFIVCSSCFALVQVPAGFASPNKKVSKLRCGSCSAVLSYSYRDPDGKKVLDDQYSTDGSEAPRGVGGGGAPARPDLFSFIEDLAHGESCSYSTTEDEQPLHVSRNSSLSTVVGASAALHRLMGYGSARELLLLPRSPSLFESFARRPTTSPSPPDDPMRHRHNDDDDRKGKGVWVDDGVAFDDDSDDDSRGALRRSSVAGWKARGGKGVTAPAGAIRIRS